MHYKHIMQKNIINRNRQQMQTMSKILQENRTHYISMPNIGKRTIHKETR